VVSGTDLFIEAKDYWNFMKRYSKYFSPYFETYAYCLIPNHFHFLVKVRSEEEVKAAIVNEDTTAANNYLSGTSDLNSFIENQFSRCFSGLSMKYNNTHNRVGPLFKQGIKRVALNKYRTFKQQMHYIHLNPTHHFLVKKIEDWPYSSYISYISDVKTQLPRQEVLDKFEGVENFISFHKTPYLGEIDFE
jgi:putative transposase